MNAPQPELIPCEYCGRLISPGRNRKRKFCNVAEKQAAYNARKKGQALAVTATCERNEPQPVASVTP
jgi:proteasome lid subunit RPN8/RPN11